MTFVSLLAVNRKQMYRRSAFILRGSHKAAAEDDDVVCWPQCCQESRRRHVEIPADTSLRIGWFHLTPTNRQTFLTITNALAVRRWPNSQQHQLNLVINAMKVFMYISRVSLLFMSHEMCLNHPKKKQKKKKQQHSLPSPFSGRKHSFYCCQMVIISTCGCGSCCAKRLGDFFCPHWGWVTQTAWPEHLFMSIYALHAFKPSLYSQRMFFSPVVQRECKKVAVMITLRIRM